MKKMMKTLVLTLTLAIGTHVMAPPAHAVIGLSVVAASPVVGGIIAVAGVAVIAVPLVQGKPMGAIHLLIGLLLLDGQGESVVGFKEMDVTDARALGLSESERLAFNDARDEINAINESVVQESMTSRGLDAGRAHALWEKYRGQLSTEAFAGLDKLSRGLARAI